MVYGPDWSGPWYGKAAECCGCGKALSHLTKRGEFIDLLSTWQILRNDCVLYRVSQSVSQSFSQSVCQPVSHLVSHSFIQPVNQSFSQSVVKPASQPVSQSLWQSASESFSQSVGQSARQPVSQLVILETTLPSFITLISSKITHFSIR